MMQPKNIYDELVKSIFDIIDTKILSTSGLANKLTNDQLTNDLDKRSLEKKIEDVEKDFQFQWARRLITMQKLQILKTRCLVLLVQLLLLLSIKSH